MTKDWLKDKVTGEKFCPITHEEAVIDNNGTALNTKLAAKQDSLVSGTNIKTINHTSLLGNGNISISAFEIIDIGQVSFSRDGYAVSETVYDPISNSFDAGKIPIVTAKLAGTPSLNVTFVIIDNVSSYVGYWHDNQASHRFATFEIDRTGGLIQLNEDQTKLVSGTNIKTINSTSILGSGDISLTPKVASTTDNAVVRFDGTAGNIQNSGVTINDSNHVTAAKFITSEGTSSQFVKGDGTLDNNSYLSSETSLSKGTTTGNGNAVTDISVSGHTITLTKGSTFLEEAYVEVNLGSITATNELYALSSSVYTQVDTIYSANKIPIVKATLASDNDQPISFLIDKIATGLYFGSCLIGNIGYACALDSVSSFIYRYVLQPELLSGTSIKTINGSSILNNGDLSLTPKVASTTDNAITRFDGTAGNIQNSGVTIDDSNNVTTAGNVQLKNVIIRGTNTSNTTRFLSSDASDNIYASINSTIPLVIKNTEVRRGQSATSVNLGSSSYPWNNVYGKKFVTDGGTNTQVVTGNGTLANISQLAVGEAYLQQGGKDFSDSYGPLDATLINELGANRLAFLPYQAVTVEYSRNDGSTWSDYEASNTEKQKLFTKGYLVYFAVGKASLQEPATTDYQLRITISYMGANLYTDLNKFAILASTGGATGCWCTIQGRTTQNVDGNIDTWETFKNKATIGGWSGQNILNCTKFTFGNKTNQYKELRFIFGSDTKGSNMTSYPTSGMGLRISWIGAYGGIGWTTPSNMAANGHLYDWDENQQMITPNTIYPKTNNLSNLGTSTYNWKNVYAYSFIKNGGTSAQFLKADGSVDSNTYVTAASLNSYYTKSDINTMLGDIESILDAIIGSDSESSI